VRETRAILIVDIGVAGALPSGVDAAKQLNVPLLRCGVACPSGVSGLV